MTKLPSVSSSPFAEAVMIGKPLASFGGHGSPFGRAVAGGNRNGGESDSQRGQLFAVNQETRPRGTSGRTTRAGLRQIFSEHATLSPTHVMIFALPAVLPNSQLA
jgi:hypothetical protein